MLSGKTLSDKEPTALKPRLEEVQAGKRAVFLWMLHILSCRLLGFFLACNKVIYQIALLQAAF
jgi:hypothetical protein